MKPFPSLPTVLGNPAKNAGLPHSPRTTTTIEFGQFYFAADRSIQLCTNRITIRNNSGVRSPSIQVKPVPNFR
jgi:hypothetical protein